ncbi:MAG: oligosaccharide flippase family protein, partial [Aeromonas sp.]
MKLDKVIIRNILSLFSIQMVNYLLPLLVVPYLVRVLGLSNFGLY